MHYDLVAWLSAVPSILIIADPDFITYSMYINDAQIRSLEECVLFHYSL